MLVQHADEEAWNGSKLAFYLLCAAALHHECIATPACGSAVDELRLIWWI